MLREHHHEPRQQRWRDTEHVTVRFKRADRKEVVLDSDGSFPQYNRLYGPSGPGTGTRSSPGIFATTWRRSLTRAASADEGRSSGWVGLYSPSSRRSSSSGLNWYPDSRRNTSQLVPVQQRLPKNGARRGHERVVHIFIVCTASP